jgi:hypothetical protein
MMHKPHQLKPPSFSNQTVCTFETSEPLDAIAKDILINSRPCHAKAQLRAGSRNQSYLMGGISKYPQP